MICIIQARLGSKRFKLKLLKKINGFSILEWVLIRARKIKKVKKIIVAIPINRKNNTLKKIIKKFNFDIYEGSENNLLNRFIGSLKKYKENNFVRICADNPFFCYDEIDHLIKSYFKYKSDYIYNHRPIKNSYPDGIGAEVSNIKTLIKIKRKAISKNHKEHIFNYINDNPKQFKINTIEPKNKFFIKPYLKLDIDYYEQFKVFNKIKIHPNMSSKEIIQKILKN